MRPVVFVSDPLAEEALALLAGAAEVVVETGLSPDRLAARLREVAPQALLIRSQTRVTEALLDAAPSLRLVGRAGVGVDNVDLPAATRRGIVVVNSPEGNTVSAAEHTLSLMLAAARRVPGAHASVARGEWERGRFMGVELYNKTLGIVGLGRIGREVAARAAAFKMRLLGHDPHLAERHARELGVELCPLDALLGRADVVTLHVPSTPETAGLFSAARLALMKPGSILVNCARGGLVDEQALATALREGPLGAAGLDVFEREPPIGSPLLTLPNVVLTPHLAASTLEAQVRVAVDVVEQTLQVLAGGAPRSAVNLAFLPPQVLELLRPYLTLAERLGALLGALSQGAPVRVRVTTSGELASTEVSPLTRAALVGLLQRDLAHGALNVVNAELLARERGVETIEARSSTSATYASLLEVEVETGAGRMRAAGAVFDDGLPRLVELDDYRVTTVLEGIKLFTWQNDTPGVVGRVGTVLGQRGVNIAEMQVGRRAARVRAVMVMSLDDDPTRSVLPEVCQLPGIEEARLVSL